MRRLHTHVGRTRRGMTLIELMVSTSISIALLAVVSVIYFACMRTYLRSFWQLPPYDTATRTVDELVLTLRKAMIVEEANGNSIVVVMPKVNNQGDNILELQGQDLHLVRGDEIMFYYSDASGTIGNSGHCLWKALKREGTLSFVPRKKVADEVYPEYNPDDPSTGVAQDTFKYWPDEVRCWGVEVTVTAIATQHSEHSYQTAGSEVYLRNL